MLKDESTPAFFKELSHESATKVQHNDSYKQESSQASLPAGSMEQLVKKSLKIKSKLHKAIDGSFRAKKGWRDLDYAGLLSDAHKQKIIDNYEKAVNLIPSLTVYICLKGNSLNEAEKLYFSQMNNIDQLGVAKAFSEKDSGTVTRQLLAIYKQASSRQDSITHSLPFNSMEDCALASQYKSAIEPLLIEYEVEVNSQNTCANMLEM